MNEASSVGWPRNNGKKNSFLPQGRSWLKFALVGSLAFGGGEIAAGQATHSKALDANAVQLVDGSTYYLLMLAHDSEREDRHKHARRNKILTGSLICAASLAVGSLAAEDITTQHKPDADTAAFAVVASGLNLFISRKLGPFAEPGTATRYGWRHSTGDAISAVAATAAIVAGGMGVPYIDPATAVATSGFTVWINIPTPGRTMPETSSL